MARIKRLEFGAGAKAEILTRAGYPHDPRCENPECRCSLKKTGGQLDHKIAEWINGGRHDERTALTADDGWMLCPECHKTKSSRETKDRAKGNRIIAKAAGLKKTKGRKIQSRGFQTNRNGPYKQRFDGTTERRI